MNITLTLQKSPLLRPEKCPQNMEPCEQFCSGNFLKEFKIVGGRRSSLSEAKIYWTCLPWLDAKNIQALHESFKCKVPQNPLN